MLSSPDRRRRGYLALALALSLLIHLTGAGLWSVLGHRIAVAIARVLPRPTPTPEVAITTVIRIEKRRPAPAVPLPKRHRALPPPPAHAAPPPPAVAQAPALRAMPVPTLAPVPTAVPTLIPPKPILPAQREPVRPALAHADVPRHASSTSRSTTKAGFSQQQIASLDAQFQHTIDSAQRSLADGPQTAQQSGSGTQTMKRYEGILAGRSEDALASEGVCDPLDVPTSRGGYNYYYLRCRVTFTDGYTEEVSFPWQFRFPPREDPFRYQDGRPHHFPVQGPPDGFALQRPFALSRTICAFYHDDCEAIVAKERAAGATQ